MRISEPIFKYNTNGRQSVENRLKLIHGNEITIIKGKGCLSQSAASLIGKTLSPQQIGKTMGEVIYPDWGGQPNTISQSAELIGIDRNQASCYLIFR